MLNPVIKMQSMITQKGSHLSQQVLTQALIHSSETFRKFYDKPVMPANNIMVSAILSQ